MLTMSLDSTHIYVTEALEISYQKKIAWFLLSCFECLSVKGENTSRDLMVELLITNVTI